MAKDYEHRGMDAWKANKDLFGGLESSCAEELNHSTRTPQ